MQSEEATTEPYERFEIGADLGSVSFPVELGKIRELAAATLEDDPAYQGRDAVAPPTFTATAALWGEPASRGLALARGRVLHGEQEYEYLAPIRVGDVLTGRRRLADVRTREGSRGGTMTFVVIETTYANQDGVDVVRERSTLIETARAPKDAM
jgi:acyl dehydratase